MLYVVVGLVIKCTRTCRQWIEEDLVVELCWNCCYFAMKQEHSSHVDSFRLRNSLYISKVCCTKRFQ